MRASLIIFGIIFLVIGGLLYFVPLQEFKVNTTTVGNGSSDTRTSSAGVAVPVTWAFASAIIGFILLILGLAISGPSRVVQGPRGPQGPRGKGPARYRSSIQRKSRRTALPRGTSVTTTTRIKR